MILDMIQEWFKELLIDGIISNLTGMFDTLNTKVGEIAGEVGMTPAAWNSSIFNMIRNLSETVIVPIAGIILTFVMCYELIQLIIEKNNLHDFDKTGLEAIEKTVIDRAVQMIYQPYFADPRPENMPILGDLMNALLSQHIPEADRVAQALDLYVNGSLNFFNHRTTVDISNRLVCFDIKGLGKNLKKPGMLIVQDAVWNTVTINRAIGRSTWYFVDEFHLLLKEEQTAAYSAEIWKRFRKWGGIPTGATQNPKDLLSSPEIENILENSDFIYMLNQAAGDRKILAERLNISSEQLTYVTNSEPGHGLLFFNNVILPFADDFPKDTELYKLLTTKPSEVEHETMKK